MVASLTSNCLMVGKYTSDLYTVTSNISNKLFTSETSSSQPEVVLVEVEHLDETLE